MKDDYILISLTYIIIYVNNILQVERKKENCEILSAQNTRDNSEIAYIEKLLVEKLFERNIQISEAILLKKYFIWNQLYLERKIEVNDEDIIMYINKVLDDMGL